MAMSLGSSSSRRRRGGSRRAPMAEINNEGVLTQVWDDFRGPAKDSRVYLVVFEFSVVVGSIAWLIPLLPYLLLLNVVRGQYAALATDIGSGDDAEPGPWINARHRVITDRMDFISRFGRIHLGIVMVAHCALNVFLAFRLVVAPIDSSEILMVQLFWFLATLAVALVVIGGAARVHAQGTSGIVAALTRSTAKAGAHPRRTAPFITIISHRQAGFRLFGAILITPSLIGKTLSLYASLLAILYNMRLDRQGGAF